MLMPHEVDNLKEKLVAIREVITDDSDIVHLQEQIDKIAEILDEIEEEVLEFDDYRLRSSTG